MPIACLPHGVMFDRLFTAWGDVRSPVYRVGLSAHPHTTRSVSQIKDVFVKRVRPHFIAVAPILILDSDSTIGGLTPHSPTVSFEDTELRMKVITPQLVPRLRLEMPC
ncbi:hypothetical protein F7734_32515 [Scytonema sp. UIC 10036]|uniref:hypothetical protein n=1 Tax=Scytonema sp. UIC 10036 TaxID=2304196 RepID=UPI0012DA9664|nr:hypothetical protein [Scytonema sp. UIC 10036]MUG96811.1 hypothetical protein [Scytonema sp. UIC 10036]